MNDQKNIALVTGAIGGLGTAMCQKLATDGYIVVANYRNEEKAQEWLKQQEKEGFTFRLAIAANRLSR